MTSLEQEALSRYSCENSEVLAGLCLFRRVPKPTNWSSVVCNYLDIQFHLNRLIRSFWGRVTSELSQALRKGLVPARSPAVGLQQASNKSLSIDEKEVKGQCSFPVIGSWGLFRMQWQRIISHDSLCLSLSITRFPKVCSQEH